MPAERKAAGFSRCITCSPQHTLKGANVYGVHKTGASLEVMHPVTYRMYRRVTARKAKGTNGQAFQQGTTSAYYKT